jgi:pyrroloquinoline-quinone synthase
VIPSGPPAGAGPLLSPDDFVARLRAEGIGRYHDQHPFHQRMHEGRLTREELQRWTLNRYYYQTRIPIKDAIIVSKSEDPAFRRAWIRRIQDHDGQTPSDGGLDAAGAAAGDGGLALWLRLAEAVGLDRVRVAACADVLPGVRFACDAYVALCRESPLVVAVASSLTEMFAPDLMSRRIASWEQHYPWVGAEALAYFRARVPRARRDGEEALAFVVAHATSRALQEACVAALVKKTEILWHLLDCVSAPFSSPSSSGGE